MIGLAFLILDESVWVEQLGSEDPQVRDTAERRLFERGSEAVPLLIKALQSRDCEVRDRARRILLDIDLPDEGVPAEILDARARHRLAGVIRTIEAELDPTRRVRSALVDKMAKPEAVPALLEIAADENRPLVLRVAAIDALGQVKALQAMKPLMGLLRSKAEFTVSDG